MATSHRQCFILLSLSVVLGLKSASLGENIAKHGVLINDRMNLTIDGSRDSCIIIDLKPNDVWWRLSFNTDYPVGVIRVTVKLHDQNGKALFSETVKCDDSRVRSITLRERREEKPGPFRLTNDLCEVEIFKMDKSQNLSIILIYISIGVVLLICIVSAILIRTTLVRKCNKPTYETVAPVNHNSPQKQSDFPSGEETILPAMPPIHNMRREDSACFEVSTRESIKAISFENQGNSQEEYCEEHGHWVLRLDVMKAPRCRKNVDAKRVQRESMKGEETSTCTENTEYEEVDEFHATSMFVPVQQNVDEHGYLKVK